MKVPFGKRADFWNFLTSEKGFRPKGITPKRLEAAKPHILLDDYIWEDVIIRHGASEVTAEEFFSGPHTDEHRFRQDHARSNFWAMVRERINSPALTR